MRRAGAVFNLPGLLARVSISGAVPVDTVITAELRASLRAEYSRMNQDLRYNDIGADGAQALMALMARAQVRAGDVLELRDGNYTGSGGVVLQIAKGIELRAQNAGMAVLDGLGAARKSGNRRRAEAGLRIQWPVPLGQ